MASENGSDWWKVLGIAGPIVLTIVGAAWFLGSKLSSVENHNSALQVRIDAIAEALPDIRVKVAYESVYGPFQSVLLVSDPRPNGDAWTRVIGVYDADSGMLNTFVLPVTAREDDAAVMQIVGRISALQSTSVALDEAEKASVEVNAPMYVSDDLDKGNSYLIRSDAELIIRAVESTGATPDGSTPQVTVTSYSDLFAEMKKNPTIWTLTAD